MNILLVMAGDEEGGLEKHVQELGDGLAGRGHRVTVVAHAKYADRFRPEVCFVPVNLARGRRHPLALWQLWRAVRGSGCEVVHAHGSKAAAMLGILLPRLGLPSVATLHSVKKNVRMFRAFDRVIAVSRMSTANLDHPGAVVIHNGIVPVPASGRDLAGEWPDGPGPRLLAVGRLVPVKGFDILLEAMRQAPGRLAIAGDGFEEDSLKQRIAALGLESRVRLLGHRRDVRDLLEAADLMVISSRYEGCPYTLVEALQAGVPVVSTAVGAMPEILPPEVMCPPGDAAALSAVLSSVMSLPGCGRGLLAPVFAHARRALTFEALLDATEAVYREAVAGKAGGGA